MVVKMRGRKKNNEKYDLYRGVEYIGTFFRDELKEKFGIQTKALKRDMEKMRIFEGGYRVYPEGRYRKSVVLKPVLEPVPETPMPRQVHGVKCSTGCRFSN